MYLLFVQSKFICKKSSRHNFEKPLERQVAEAVAIQNCKADLVLNSKAEWEQPAVERLVVTRELDDLEDRRGGARRGRQPRAQQQ